MKQLTCEMCGSTDLLKQDGVFVCQTCGCKYSVEEAKKMMIEGAVEVTGSVSIDDSKETNNIYILARRARSEGNSENAKKYYTILVEKNPNDWEASFYSAYYTTVTCVIGDIEICARNLGAAFETSFALIENQELNETKQKYREEMYDLTMTLLEKLQEVAANHHIKYNDNKYKWSSNEFADVYCQIGNVCYPINNTWAYRPYFLADIYGPGLNEVGISRIREVNPSFKSRHSTDSEKSSGGCYVATCVYGSYDCPQVWTLRRYRDDTLGATWYGRLFIRTYYAISPTLVKWFGHTDWFKKMWKGKLDRMVDKLQSKGVENTPYEDKTW